MCQIGVNYYETQKRAIKAITVFNHETEGVNLTKSDGQIYVAMYVSRAST